MGRAVAFSGAKFYREYVAVNAIAYKLLREMAGYHVLLPRESGGPPCTAEMALEYRREEAKFAPTR